MENHPKKRMKRPFYFSTCRKLYYTKNNNSRTPLNRAFYLKLGTEVKLQRISTLICTFLTPPNAVSVKFWEFLANFSKFFKIGKYCSSKFTKRTNAVQRSSILQTRGIEMQLPFHRRGRKIFVVRRQHLCRFSYRLY